MMKLTSIPMLAMLCVTTKGSRSEKTIADWIGSDKNVSLAQSTREFDAKNFKLDDVQFKLESIQYCGKRVNPKVEEVVVEFAAIQIKKTAKEHPEWVPMIRFVKFVDAAVGQEKTYVKRVCTINLDNIVGTGSVTSAQAATQKNECHYYGSRKMKIVAKSKSSARQEDWLLTFPGVDSAAEASRLRFVEMFNCFKNKLKNTENDEDSEFRWDFRHSINRKFEEEKDVLRGWGRSACMTEEDKSVLGGLDEEEGCPMLKPLSFNDLTIRRRLATPIEHLLCEIAQLQ